MANQSMEPKQAPTNGLNGGATQANQVLYPHVFGWPEDGKLEINSEAKIKPDLCNSLSLTQLNCFEIKHLTLR